MNFNVDIRDTRHENTQKSRFEKKMNCQTDKIIPSNKSIYFCPYIPEDPVFSTRCNLCFFFNFFSMVAPGTLIQPEFF